MFNLFKRNKKEESRGVKILNVIPVDWYELIIVLENGQIRSFEPSKYNLYDEYKFLASPGKLRSFTIDDDKIEWTSGVTFNSYFLIQNSVELETDELKRKKLSIGRKNQAPTSEDQRHHIYDVAIRPYNSEMPIILSESIGGGHGDRGGSRNIKIEEIKEYKDHFELSDCIWAYQLIKKSDDDIRGIMDALISEFLNQKYQESG
jgi:hypothetical protein